VSADPSCPTDIEARLAQLLPELDFAPDPALVAAGWERRFMADAGRAREATALYSDLGFEVSAEPVRPEELSAACGDCRVATCLAYVTLYTRRPARRTEDRL
jgi:hypothetical protein